MGTTVRTAIGLLAVAALATLTVDAQSQKPAAAQQAQPPQQPPARPAEAAQDQTTGREGGQQPPSFRTNINFVRVDVIITDKAGNPISDLKESDFDVSEDNKPQKIESFKLVKLDGGIQESIKEAPRQIRTDYDEESEAGRDDVRLFGVFLDDYHVRKGTSMAAANPLYRFIQTQIGPSDMVGVMYPLETTGSVRFTRNHEAVAKALQEFRGRKYDYTPRNQYEEQYAHYPTETVERIRNEVSLSAIKALITHMGGLKEGRKSLILVTEGYTYMVPPQMRNADSQLPGLGNPNALNPLAGLNDPNEDRAQWMADNDILTDLRNVWDTANRNNVSIYTVDPRGLPGFEFDINEGVNIQTDQKFLTSTQDTLRSLAENTDGRAIVNRNDLDVAMKQIVKDSSAYYLLGYNSTQAPTDGKFHEIKVKVKRPGVEVRARKGYWALNAEQTARALAPPKPDLPKPMEAALAAIGRPSGAAVVRTWIGTSRGENGKTRVTLVWEPMPKSAGGRETETPARVSVMALGTDGSPYFRGRVPDVALASTTPSAGAGGGAAPKGPQRVSFEAAPGKMQLRLSVEGTASQVLDTEVREITVPDMTSPTSAIGTPEVFRARTARDLQQLKADADPVPITTREFTRMDRLVVRVPAYGPGGTSAALSVHLLNRAGQPISEVSVVAAPKPGEQQFELPLAGMAAGEYILEIKTTGEGGEAKELLGFRITG
ncbi:MAG TPA: VWA domain-containing protein [Vicinamibacterales bacterium]|nr:VWA domain-containing protein [Vicinamibacterales bacterium]